MQIFYLMLVLLRAGMETRKNQASFQVRFSPENYTDVAEAMA